MDATLTDRLVADHRLLRRRLRRVTPPRGSRGEWVEEMRSFSLTLGAQQIAEDEMFELVVRDYPGLTAAAGHSRVLHELLDDLLQTIQTRRAAGSEELCCYLVVLADLLGQHLDREEAGLIATLRRVARREQLLRWGEDYRRRRNALLEDLSG